MLSRVHIILSVVVITTFTLMLVTIKVKDKQVATCKANTKLQKALYKKAINGYENAIQNIDKVYDEKLSRVINFERRVDETDCDASYRFFNNVNY